MKKIALAADHAGYELKNHLVAYLAEKGCDCINHGTDTADSLDYPVYLALLALGKRVVVYGVEHIFMEEVIDLPHLRGHFDDPLRAVCDKVGYE